MGRHRRESRSDYRLFFPALFCVYSACWLLEQHIWCSARFLFLILVLICLCFVRILQGTKTLWNLWQKKSRFVFVRLFGCSWIRYVCWLLLFLYCIFIVPFDDESLIFLWLMAKWRIRNAGDDDAVLQWVINWCTSAPQKPTIIFYCRWLSVVRSRFLFLVLFLRVSAARTPTAIETQRWFLEDKTSTWFYMKNAFFRV